MTRMEDTADMVPVVVGIIRPAFENEKATLVIFPICTVGNVRIFLDEPKRVFLTLSNEL